MVELLYAVALYVCVFGIDYLFHMKQKSHYQYVSRRTYALFIGAQIATIWLFYDLLEPFVTNYRMEGAFLATFLILLFIFTYQLTKVRVFVCNLSSHSVRCLTPGYVLVKGAEVAFQQMIYAVIALTLVSLLGLTILTYAAYISLLLIIHIVLTLNCSRDVKKRLNFGLFVIAVPIFYIFIELELFWPAVYLHSIMYVFYWVIFADFDVSPLTQKS